MTPGGTGASEVWVRRCPAGSESVWLHRLHPTGLLCPYGPPGKSTEVGSQSSSRKSRTQVIPLVPTFYQDGEESRRDMPLFQIWKLKAKTAFLSPHISKWKMQSVILCICPWILTPCWYPHLSRGRPDSIPQQGCQMTSGLPRWLSGKESSCQWKGCRRREFNPWVGKALWRREWQPTPVFLPRKFHGQRILMGSCP